MKNPNKFGLPKECDVELIKIAKEGHIDGADKKWVVGYVVVLFEPINGSKVAKLQLYGGSFYLPTL